MLDVLGNLLVIVQGEPDKSESISDHCRGLIGNSVIHPAAFLAAHQQAGMPKDRKMLGHGGWSKPQQFDHLADAQFAVTRGGQRPDSVWVSQGPGYGQKLFHPAASAQFVSRRNNSGVRRSWQVKIWLRAYPITPAARSVMYAQAKCSIAV